MGSEFFTKLAEKYPFITLLMYAGDEYVGIVQNRDETVTTIYDYGQLTDHEMKVKFLDLANIWWWESNRSIPINIFLKADWEPYRLCLRTFSNRDLTIVYGPVCSLSDIVRKKSKRKSITLVRKIR